MKVAVEGIPDGGGVLIRRDAKADVITVNIYNSIPPDSYLTTVVGPKVITARPANSTEVSPESA